MWGWAANKPPIIFHGCYAVNDYILSRCGITITDMDKVVDNYERLNVDDKARVPDKYYQLALPFVRARPEQKLAEDVKKAESPKN